MQNPLTRASKSTVCKIFLIFFIFSILDAVFLVSYDSVTQNMKVMNPRATTILVAGLLGCSVVALYGKYCPIQLSTYIMQGGPLLVP